MSIYYSTCFSLGNPFLEADKQVKQMVDKMKQGKINNAFDGKETDKIVEKDNIVCIDDVKISNLMKESNTAQENVGVPAEAASSSSSSRQRSVDGLTQSRDSTKDSGKYDQLRPVDRTQGNVEYKDSVSSTSTCYALQHNITDI